MEFIRINGNIIVFNDISFLDKYSVSFELFGVELFGICSDLEEELFSKLRAFDIIIR
jgi:hypothetical protein